MSVKFSEILALAIFLVLKFSLSRAHPNSQSYIFPCYYVYEPQLLKPESIPLDLCTHIILIGCVQEKLNDSRALLVEEPYNCASVLRKVSNLKNLNPKLKIVISMATDGNAMHEIVKNQYKIDEYVESAIKIAIDYKYDGLDFDWEYPCDEDKLKFTDLLRTFRNEIKKNNLNLTLSAAIGAGLDIIKRCFDLDGLSKYLDYINVMCYDYNTIYNKYTAYASPLFARPEEVGYDATLNSNFTISYMIEQNVPKEKIILGLNAGGHTFQLADPKKNGFHAPVLGIGYSSGWSLYPQLCRFIRDGGVGIYDEIAHVLYAYYDDQWANTGDVRSAAVKAEWAKKMGLGGVFTWCLNWDDLDNSCGHNIKFPIHKAIRDNLFN